MHLRKGKNPPAPPTCMPTGTGAHMLTDAQPVQVIGHFCPQRVVNTHRVCPPRGSVSPAGRCKERLRTERMPRAGADTHYSFRTTRISCGGSITTITTTMPPWPAEIEGLTQLTYEQDTCAGQDQVHIHKSVLGDLQSFGTSTTSSGPTATSSCPAGLPTTWCRKEHGDAGV